jgi:hypothetical protein
MPKLAAGKGTMGDRRSFMASEPRRIEMTMRNLFLAGAAACGFAMLATAPAAARTVCDAYGNCYNTSGRPVYQPQYEYGYGYGYVPRPYWSYRRHDRRYDDGNDEE